MIKAIIFDFFGVFYTDQFTNFIDHSLPQLQPQLQDLMLKLDLGQIDKQTVISSYAKLCNLPQDQVEEQLYGVNLTRNHQLLNYTQQLRQNYKIGLISNASPGSIDKYFTQPERTQFFDSFIVSCEVDLIKPWPQIYLLAADKLNIQPQEAVFIDDNLLNCKGAQKVGMQAIQYRNFMNFKNQLEQLLKV